MSMKTIFRAAFVGATVAFTCVPALNAQALKVMQGSTASDLDVPMNRAVVVESDVPFAELSIANPSIADISTLSDRTIYVLGKEPGRTTLTLLGPDGRLITNVQVRVTADISELKERLREVLPSEKIEVRPANDGVVLSGIVSSVASVDRALDLAQRYAPGRVSNLMTIGGSQQVLLKVRFAEMNRAVTKSLSSSIAFNGASGNVGGVGGNGTLIDGTNLNTQFDGDPSTGIVRGSQSTGVLALGIGAGNVEFAVLLEALETKGFVRTLAEPNLTALSGQSAEFLAGGEYPVPFTNENGSITVDFKPFGIELGFTPHVVGKNINLRMNASVSSIDPTTTYTDGSVSIAGFSTRSTSTTVELQDGESFAVAGLLQDDFTSLKSQVPWLGDVPILGALFRSSEYQRSQSELVIIITAHLVTPTIGEAFALPTDRVRPPTEHELFIGGKLSSNKAPKGSPAAEVARQDFQGSYGYVME